MNRFKDEWSERLTKEPFLQRNFTDRLMLNVEGNALKLKKKDNKRTNVYVALGGMLVVILFLLVVPFLKPDILSSGNNNMQRMTYTSEQLDLIRTEASNIGISHPLLPTISVEGDQFYSVQRDTDSMVLEYTDMTVTLFTTPFQSPDAYQNSEQKIKPVKLKNGTDGFWMYDNDYLPSKRKFRFIINDLSVQIQDHRFLPEEQVQAIAESFAPLN
ncbi:hypothetical protein SAMN05880570_4024 [Paenibacillus sp. RU4T]|jgi:hypothetical protein|uniref:hypothetical protein n=1 Tax=unclassified Paenibacillus TaxID=185978 RepID=UPI0009570C80|nr:MULTISPECIES: hypothetical protein [unclassified Paenibacillus]SIR50350.1 hypothetical protein SAMN05880555_4021 [Paenibacillus sp. RU4X]SIR59412.1 hypothetical protein SAMN05880570_4024 [Paenibacillus sp. RU4T]